MWQKLHDTGFGNDFLVYDTKDTGNKRKVEKSDFVKI